MYKRQESACVHIEGADLSEQLRAAVLNVEGEISEADLPDLEISEQVSICLLYTSRCV